MTRMFASDPHCQSATMERSGRTYKASKAGFINVESPRDVKDLVNAGYVVSGSTPKTKRTYICHGCGWEALIKHCPHCDRDDLERVEG
jgi:lipopolysaccharide biosynthesis regulator YciM